MANKLPAVVTNGRVEQLQATDNPSIPGVLTSVNFKKIFLWNTVTVWASNGTTPNGNLTGVAGDICLNGSNSDFFKCLGGTVWTTSSISDVSSTTVFTTTSATDTLLTSMTLTPGIGVYKVGFSANCSVTTATNAKFSIYVNGVQVAQTLRVISPTSPNFKFTASIMDTITVSNAAHVVDVRVSQAATMTIDNRYFSLTRKS